MKTIFRYAILSPILFVLCTKDTINYSTQLDAELQLAMTNYSPDASFDYYLLPSSENLNALPQDPNNELNASKVALGQLLFFETAFSSEAKYESGKLCYSCSSCHIPESGFGPGRIQGIGDGGVGIGIRGEERKIDSEYSESEIDIQGIKALNLVNVAFVKNTFWNGQFGSEASNEGTDHLWDQREDTERNAWGFKAIETQNFEGVDAHRIKFTEEKIIDSEYDNLFDLSFPYISISNRYSNHTAALALSAYIRTLITDKAPFQRWLKGNSDAMSNIEKEGAILFFGKAKCVSCHYNKNLGSGEFHALGVKDMDQNPLGIKGIDQDRRNLGRAGFTLEDEDLYKFKVPGLYNISDSPYYFHGASKETLQEVIEYKITAKRENIRVPTLRLSEKLHKIKLTDSEIQKLVSFLSISLRDPDLVRYKPTEVLSGSCFPNNDAQSRIDLGCQ